MPVATASRLAREAPARGGEREARALVGGGDVAGGAVELEPPAVDEQRARAGRDDGGEVVADEEHRAPLAR